MDKLTTPLELRIRVMEDDRYESGEEPVEGEWQYADIESILLDLRRYLPLEETPEGVRLYAKSSVPTAPSYYLLAGRQQDPIRNEKIEEALTPVVKKHFPVWKCSDRTSYRYPRYAALGLLLPEGTSVSSTEKNEVISALKVVALKNLLELYIRMKKIPGLNELPFLPGEDYQPAGLYEQELYGSRLKRTAQEEKAILEDTRAALRNGRLDGQCNYCHKKVDPETSLIRLPNPSLNDCTIYCDDGCFRMYTED